MMLVTFLATLFIGIAEGVLTGVVLSVLVILLKASKPHTAVLGRLPNTAHFRNTERFPEAEEEEGVIVFRFDAPLYFMNTSHFEELMEDIIVSATDLRLLILDAGSITDMDASGAQALRFVVEQLQQADINFYICGVRGPVRDLLKSTGLMDTIGPKNHFLDVNQAMLAWKAEEQQRDKSWKAAAIQAKTRRN